MDFAFFITVAITVLSTIVIPLLDKYTPSAITKQNIAIGLSFLIAIAYLFITEPSTLLSSLTIAIPAVFGLQQAAYLLVVKHFFQDKQTKEENIAIQEELDFIKASFPSQSSQSNNPSL